MVSYNIGKSLRFWLSKRGLSIEDFAHSVDLVPRAIVQFLGGLPVSGSQLECFAAALGITSHQLADPNGEVEERNQELTASYLGRVGHSELLNAVMARLRASQFRRGDEVADLSPVHEQILAEIVFEILRERKQ